MIVILDCDMGNVCSIENMLKKIGEKPLISRNPHEIEEADKIILPGVGSFDTGIEQLQKYALVELIKNHAQQKPLLGICLGMQLLGRKSEEGLKEGLGLVPFDCVRFNFDSLNNGSELKIPHMGWDYTRSEMIDPLTEGLPSVQRYYFVHSYHAVCDSRENILMTCEYGYRFTAAVKNGKVYGVQFHPEKSHKYGMEILKHFVQKV